jgi:cell division septation protein DedD
VNGAEPALAKSSGKRFTDEQIFNLLRAAEGEPRNMTALCDASGVTVPTYCLWKARYGKLTLEELRSARAIESRRAFTRHALVAVGVGVVLTTLGFSISAWFSPSESAAASRVVTAARRDVAPPPPVPATSLTPAAAKPVADAAPNLPATAADVPAPVEEGYSVQLAALPDVREASAKVEQLTSAGYTAYLHPITAADVTLYRVRIGPFDALRDAQDVVRRLKRDGYDGSWIAK